MARREGLSERRRPRRQPRARVLVVCGAQKTEEAYFAGLRQKAGNRAVDVKVLSRPKDPLTVVRFALGEAERSRDDFDQVWCVFDVDDFDIRQAVVEAAAANVYLAISNPCFELWLLLHHEKCNRYFNDCDEAKLRIKRYVAAYDKTRLRFDDFATGVTNAVQRARELEATSDGVQNPGSGVWRLASGVWLK